MAQRVGRDIALLFHDCGTRRGEWSAACPGRTLPPGKSRYPFYRRLGGPEGSRKLRLPDFMTTAQDGGKVVSLTHWLPLPPGNAPSIHFC